MTDKQSAITEIERLLTRSKVFGAIWLMGIGSVISLHSAYKASKLMKKEGMSDKGRLFRLYALGLAGLIVSITSVIVIVLFRKGK